MNISEGTVRNPLSRLQEQEIIQVIGMTNPYNLGFDAPAIAAISLAEGRIEPGVHAPEASLDPETFFKELEQREIYTKVSVSRLV